MRKLLSILVLTLISCEEETDKETVTKQPVFNVSPQNNDLGTVMVGEEHTIPLRISSLYGDTQITSIEIQNVTGNYCSFNGNLPTVAGGTNQESGMKRTRGMRKLQLGNLGTVTTLGRW